jgi:hypothetical protein
LESFVNKHDLWAQFDGVGSFCKLTEEQADELLRETDLAVTLRQPPSLKTSPQVSTWLERTPQDTYTLWHHIHEASDFLRKSTPDDCVWHSFDIRLGTADTDDDSETKLEPGESTLHTDALSPLRSVRLHAGDERLKAHQQRLNPSTRQRARYWTHLDLILQELASNANSASSRKPLILFVQNDDDIGNIQRFFSARNWKVVQGGTLRRAAERLSSSSHGRRVLVVPLRRWTEIMTLDLALDVHVAIEGLPIKRLQAFSRSEAKSTRQNALVPESGEESPGDAPQDSSGLRDDADQPARPYRLQQGLDQVAPLLRWLAYTTKLISPQGSVFVLDPRVEPMQLKGGPRVHSCKARAFGEAAFDRALESARQYFASPVASENLDLPDDWEQTLARVFLPPQEDGSPGTFRDYQKAYLPSIMERERDVLVELPTGSGKSVLFQAPALYHGLQHGLLTIVVTPLKALMVDQVYALFEQGFLSSVDYVNGDLSQMEVNDVYRRLTSGEIAMLYVAPERFRSRSFEAALLARLEADGMPAYIVFDEAHCLSLWGLDFRPDFLRAAGFVNRQRRRENRSFPCLMLSATITEQVYEHLHRLFTYRASEPTPGKPTHS